MTIPGANWPTTPLVTDDRLYYVAHRGDKTTDDIERLDRDCAGDHAPCAYIHREGDVITSMESKDRKATATPVWADLSVTGCKSPLRPAGTALCGPGNAPGDF